MADMGSFFMQLVPSERKVVEPQAVANSTPWIFSCEKCGAHGVYWHSPSRNKFEMRDVGPLTKHVCSK